MGTIRTQSMKTHAGTRRRKLERAGGRRGAARLESSIFNHPNPDNQPVSKENPS
jgi:hypothetical protein